MEIEFEKERNWRLTKDMGGQSAIELVRVGAVATMSVE